MGSKLRDLLRDVIPEHLLKEVPSSYDIIGDIIVVELPQTLKDYWRDIAHALHKLHKHVNTIYVKTSGVKGDYRVREITPIWGAGRKYTIHKEYGVKLVVNVAETYFNPSLGYEHYRVSRLVTDNEVVYDMFSGAGGFSLHIACRRNSIIYASDINPHAILCLVLSIVVNKLKGKIIPILGDAKVVASKVIGKVDRVIMNLPERSHEFIGYALKCLKDEGGIMHYYHFDYSTSIFLSSFIREVGEAGGKVVKILHVRKVLEAAPYKYLYVADAYVMP